MPLVFPISGIAAAVVGQTSSSARSSRTRSSHNGTSHIRARRGRRGRRPQDWRSPAPRITQLLKMEKRVTLGFSLWLEIGNLVGQTPFGGVAGASAKASSIKDRTAFFHGAGGGI